MKRKSTISLIVLTAIMAVSMAMGSYADYIVAPGVTVNIGPSDSDSSSDTGTNYVVVGGDTSVTSSSTSTATIAAPGVEVSGVTDTGTAAADTAEEVSSPLLTATVDNTESINTKMSNVTTDPILGVEPFVHAQLLLSSGNLTEGFTTNMGAFSSPEEGFTGLCLRFENHVGDVYYRVYREGMGWTKWAMNEMITPFNSETNKVTAVQIRIKGHTRNLYDLYYRAVLDDGSVLGWAHDGQSSGTIGKGRYIQRLQMALWPNGTTFKESTDNHFLADNYEGVVLGANGVYTYSTWNGEPYTGWGYDTNNNKYYFVDSNIVTGWQYIDGYKYYFDGNGCVVTDLEPIIGIQDSYQIKINKDMKTMTIYAQDGDNGYIMPVKVILNTIGPDTPIGTFETYEKYRWKFMHDDIYCQFLLRFKNGFLLHSIIYEGEPTSYNLNAATYNYLGKNQSDGCVRMTSGDAYWVYTNCGVGTTVIIYEDEWSTGPFDRPAIEQAIPFDQNYDPTDPVIVETLQADSAAAAEAVQEAVTGEEARPTEIVSE